MAGATHTSGGEAAGGHAGGAEGASDGNHGDGVDGRSGDELEMNWSFNGWGVVGGGWRRWMQKLAEGLISRQESVRELTSG